MRDLNAMPLPALFADLTGDGALPRLIELAIWEDLGRSGDVTTGSVVEPHETIDAAISARTSGVVAGLALVPHLLASSPGGVLIEFDPLCEDGDACIESEVLGRLGGRRAAILTLERTLLNFLGRLSGVATLTRRYVEAIEGTNAVICDTRKTTPGLRALEKYAVRCGGGTLHRVGLFDAALFKDNHLAGIAIEELGAVVDAAATRARQAHDVRFIEVEVDSLEQLEALLTLKPGVIDIVLLDNMTPDVLRRAVELRDQHATGLQLEASGGVTLKTVRAIAETGVDRISVGALTHSAPSLDVGLDFEVA